GVTQDPMQKSQHARSPVLMVLLPTCRDRRYIGRKSAKNRHARAILETINMHLYVTYGSPYARLARIIVIEKALENRVEIIEAKTRTLGSPYYQINPSGRVPYLVDDAGVGMEDSQLICAFLDSLDGRPRFHNASHASDWTYLRL